MGCGQENDKPNLVPLEIIQPLFSVVLHIHVYNPLPYNSVVFD